MSSSTKLIQWNCRGLKTNFNELKLLFQKHNPLIFALQETHLKESDNITFRSYELYNAFSPVEDNDRAKGGSSLLIKQGIIHSHIPLITNLQAVAVRVTLHKTVTLCSIYIPPSSHLDLKALDNLVEQLPPPFLLLGDFNGHNPLWGCDDYNTKGRLLERFIDAHALCLFNDGSDTYLHPGTGTYTAIDLSLTNSDILTDFSWQVMGDLCGSDHFPIILENDTTTLEERIPQWNLKKADWGAFTALCLTQLLDLSFNDTLDPLTTFTNTLIAIADQTIPKTSTIPPRPHLPWNNKECKEAVKARKKAERKFNRQPSSENLSNVRILRARARRSIKQFRRTSWREFVSKLTTRTPMRKVWNMIQKLKGKTSKSGVKHLLTTDGDLLTTKPEIAEDLASTFANNSSTTSYTHEFQKFKDIKEKQYLNFKSRNTEDYNEPFTLAELMTALQKSHDTATGPDQVHYQLLKHLPDECLRTLLDLYNDVWDTGNIPPPWKEATVIPIPKPGKDHTKAINYRPIALTSCLCKTMERMLNDRLVYVLEYNGLITDFQCGFRKNRSTTDHLVRLETFIRDAFVKKEHVAVFFYLEKAYDTTWKYGILKDLHDLGFRGRLPEFILNFLGDRAFRVRVGSTLSDLHEQEMGVPQGSILSVTLFSIKINAIVKTIQKGVSPSLYVDDYNICYRAKRMATIERHLQLSLNKLHTWSLENGFKFSKSKTVCMHFCRLRTLHLDPVLTLGGEPILVVKETRFLGMLFDSILNFLPHIKALKARGLKALDIIKVVSNKDWGADSSVLLQLYRSLVRSKLDYGCIVYGSACKSYIKQLDTIHHQGLRLCLGAYRTSPVESLYTSAYEPSLENRRLKLSLQYVTKLAANPSNPAYTSVFFPLYPELYQAKPKTIKPLCLRIQPHLEAAALDLQNVAKTQISEIPPWQIFKPEVHLHLTKHKKSDTDPSIFHSEFLEFKSQFPGYFCFYTDGSKDGDRVSSAAICKQYQKSERLPNQASIYTAEINAILLALGIMEHSNRMDFLLFSDSLSTLQALQSRKTDHPLLLKVLLKLTELDSKGFNIVFCWVPSHVGLAGNEKADLVAKQALTLPEVEPCFFPYTDLRQYISFYVTRLWQEAWSTQTSNKLFAIQPELCFWHPYRDLPRRDQVILTRCRIGHSRMTHSWLLKAEPEPQCVFCDCPVTIKHLLLDCSDLAIARQQFFNTTFFVDLKDLFAFNPNVLIGFLKAAGLHNHL